MWLADSLHNFDRLARAVKHQSRLDIETACDSLISMYASYGNDDTGNKSEPKHTFERHSHLVCLEEGIDIFQAIKQRASELE